MNWLKFVIFFIGFCAVFGEDFSKKHAPQEPDGMSETDRQGWLALKAFQEDDSIWIPRDGPQQSSVIQIQKRRRLRKRKRKPTLLSVNEDFKSEEISDRVQPTSRLHPQSLEQDLEPWKEVAEDVVKRPNVRRRVTPAFQPSDELNGENDKSVQEPVVSIEEETAENGEQPAFDSSDEVGIEISKNTHKESEAQRTTIPNLKAVLKQSGTGSLSEILQQKNLSLTELLMGNQRAISALTEVRQDVTEATIEVKTEPPAASAKYKRLPPVAGLNRHFEQEEDSFETLSTKEASEAQRNRFSLLGHKENKLLSKVTKYDVITQSTTERRIFVPSHPKYYTSRVFKPDFDIYNEQSTEPLQETTNEESVTTTSTTPRTVKTTSTLYLKPKVKDLPLTNAKLNKLTNKLVFKIEEPEEENYPIGFNFPKPVPINIQEVFGYKQDQSEGQYVPKADNNDGPLKLSIDLDAFTKKTMHDSRTENYIYPKTTPMNLESTTFVELYNEKLAHATAKDEIMEIMKDPISRERLSRVLENRNMTVKELVEQRERGSSQLHLADIFHNKTREPEPKGEPFIGTINAELINNFPVFDRQPKSRTFEKEEPKEQFNASNSTSTVSMTETSEKIAPESTFTVTSFPIVKIGVESSNDQIYPFLWKELHPDLLPHISQNNNNREENIKLDDALKDIQEISQEKYSEEELQRLEDLDPTSAMASKENFNVETRDFQQEEDVLINIPSGVKSAIFVSLGIVCLSIVVFLTILLVFRWAQRQNRKINYCSSLSTKIKSPIIIQRRPTNVIKSFVTETLGRKSNHYYKSNVQSTDDLWECGRERIPSF